MASLSTDGTGNCTVQFISPADGKRRSIRLGKVSKKLAESVKLKVEALVPASVAASYYLTVRECDFARGVGGGTKSGAASGGHRRTPGDKKTRTPCGRPG